MNSTYNFQPKTPTLGPQISHPQNSQRSIRRRMHTLRGVYYAHMMHMRSSVNLYNILPIKISNALQSSICA